MPTIFTTSVTSFACPVASSSFACKTLANTGGTASSETKKCFCRFIICPSFIIICIHFTLHHGQIAIFPAKRTRKKKLEN